MITGAKRKLPCFIRWYNGILREISLHFRDKSKKVSFSNPYINCGKIPHTQLTIPFGRANIEAAKKRYLAAYFDVVPEVEFAEVAVSQATTVGKSSDVIEILFLYLSIRASLP